MRVNAGLEVGVWKSQMRERVAQNNMRCVYVHFPDVYTYIYISIYITGQCACHQVY